MVNFFYDVTLAAEITRTLMFELRGIKDERKISDFLMEVKFRVLKFLAITRYICDTFWNSILKRATYAA